VIVDTITCGPPAASPVGRSFPGVTVMLVRLPLLPGRVQLDATPGEMAR